VARKQGQRHRVGGHQDDGHHQEKGGGRRLYALLDDEPADMAMPATRRSRSPCAAGEIRHGRSRSLEVRKSRVEVSETHGNGNEDPSLQYKQKPLGPRSEKQQSEEIYPGTLVFPFRAPQCAER